MLRINLLRRTLVEEKRARWRRDAAKWRKANPARASELDRKSKYGIIDQEYNALLKKQDGGCAICGGSPGGRWNRFHVDHDHTTNAVRGLLCHGCNTALGGFRESSEILRRAIEYLAQPGMSTDQLHIGEDWTRRGSRHHNAKLDENKAKEILVLCREGKLPYCEIAERFGISRNTVSRIAKHKAWKHITAVL